ncbi:helix-turn-helix domain-containing protein [Actinoplanes sp. CA-142083]|uniref:helix-turn-helix domain-containing protein n=1 Tax=Actinoplanes sp. CA-142083 TaxID=3239903 RepID=UPI003D8FABE7
MGTTGRRRRKTDRSPGCQRTGDSPAGPIVEVPSDAPGHELNVVDDGVHLRHHYRVYPAPGQRIMLARAFGCARVVFNDALRARREAHERR